MDWLDIVRCKWQGFNYPIPILQAQTNLEFEVFSISLRWKNLIKLIEMKSIPQNEIKFQTTLLIENP